ncbi:protein translocase subunit SecD [Rhodobacter sp. KR11]|uniref:protein translocase subunit SecD n=1 Tax=Rhodobacter sp. KR11 TaxID=2974588 RepID=UPI002223906F|nr:protein translocase subunit SecD [Rhodobacter sp. KR11]MCW1920266.1 protein translocase subunit SecD [Rhodobacter sp. KR11]
MLHTPLWKRLLIWAAVVLGLVLASPNLFYARVESHNDAQSAIAKSGGTATAEQEAAVASWPAWAPSSLVNLGLDLRGGAHLLAEVQLADVYKQRMDSLWPEARDALKPAREATGGVKRAQSPDGTLRIAIANADGVQAALEALRPLASPVVSLTGAGSSNYDIVADGQDIVITLSEAEKAATDARTLQQSLEIIRRRVDAAGTREPSIQRQGADRILIEVPGVGSAEELKTMIGTTAKLSFNTVVGTTQDAEANPGPGNILAADGEREGLYFILDATPVVSGDNLVDAQPSFDQNGRPAVSFRFDTTGARKFGEYTGANIGAPFAILLDDKVISAPTIQTAITGGSGIITGSFTVEESTNLAVLLRAGALPAEMKFLEEKTVGPELGQDSIDAGRTAAVIGLVAVAIFMIASYGLFGVFANIALLINLGMIFGILSLIGGTLTLPGIAGLVLTIGTAVDANVLVYERIREELRLAKSAARAIELGYERAMSAIVDANVTAMITAIVLFYFGSGPVRGFAVTLFIGIITSVFTALYVTRLIIELWINRAQPKTLVV